MTTLPVRASLLIPIKTKTSNQCCPIERSTKYSHCSSIAQTKDKNMPIWFIYLIQQMILTIKNTIFDQTVKSSILAAKKLPASSNLNQSTTTKSVSISVSDMSHEKQKQVVSQSNLMRFVTMEGISPGHQVPIRRK